MNSTRIHATPRLDAQPVEVLAVSAFGESLKIIGRGLETGLTHDPI